MILMCIMNNLINISFNKCISIDPRNETQYNRGELWRSVNVLRGFKTNLVLGIFMYFV